MRGQSFLVFSVFTASSLSFLLSLFAFTGVEAKDLKLTILHTNDVHARFLQTSKYSGTCSENDARKNECYGGFPRLHYKVSEIRQGNPNVVYLSGGDYFQGTIWYTIYKWKVVSRFVNILNHTAMALGNHEFDDNLEGLIPFLDAATFPVISANIDTSREPRIEGKFKKSIVVLYEGVKVGIIGYTTTETKAIASPGDLIFQDEVEAIKAESERLDGMGVKILIAVGHAGYDVDMLIAEKVPLIDVVVGGHTNTFLYNGTAPDVEVPAGDYPTVITQPSGRKVAVVQAYAFGKYLGYLNVTFNEAGEATEWSGNPILMDHTIPQDPELLDTLTELGENLTASLREEIGKTHVFLNGSAGECRLRECNLGNIVTDAMVYINLKYPDEVIWSDVTMAIINGGGIRSSIDERSKNGSITAEDVLTILPFRNTIDLIEIKGKHIREAFEYCVDVYDPSGHHLAGKFLQISGLRVVYDLSQPVNSRVRSLEVLCSRCRVPEYVPIDPEEVYKVAVPTYIALGGDGFEILKQNTIRRHENGILDSEMMVKFVQSRSPIIQGIDGRIKFWEAPSPSAAPRGHLDTSYVTFLALLIPVLTSRFITNLQ